jgi:hypothetical protein
MWQKRFRLDRYPIFQELYHCGLSPEQLHRISDEFGPLPEIGRKRLHVGIIRIVQSNWVSEWGWAKGAPASTRADRFRVIEDRANEFLTLLGAGVVGSPVEDKPLKANMDLLGDLGDEIARVLIQEGKNNRTWQNILRVLPAEGRVVGGVPTEFSELPIGVTSGGALNLVRMALTVLAKGASQARTKALAAVSPGRGGARRKGPTSSSAFARDLVALYCEMRRRYPSSGPVPGYSRGGPLARFVLTVFAALRERDPELRPISDASIGSLFYEVRKSNITKH